MRFAVIAVLIAGCAHHTSHVRDPQGRPLPTTAILDADSDGAQLYCTDGSHYVIVEPPRPYLAGNHLVTQRVVISDAPRLCEQIRDADYGQSPGQLVCSLAHTASPHSTGHTPQSASHERQLS